MQEFETTLFEIPIYSMSEKKFKKRWDEKRKSLFDEFISHEHTEEGARQSISRLYYPQWVWRYNQIVGYIKISVSAADVLVDLYCVMCDKLYVDSSKRNYIVDWRTNGTHFYVGKQSDDEIKKQILSLLKSIEHDHLKGRYYIDYSTFNNVFGHINIKEIMESL